MSTRPRRHVGWLTGLLNVVLGLAALLAVGVGQPVVETATWEPPQTTAHAEWSHRLAGLFPGCRAELPEGVIPSAVVWIKDGWPVRVAFTTAWARTHDEGASNHGEVVALCR